MTGIGLIDGFNSLSLMKSTQAKRYGPEPKSTDRDFSWVKAVEIAKEIAEKGLSFGGIDGDYAAFLERQIEMQEQMMLVSMTSNIEKARHETRMASVRNMRVT